MTEREVATLEGFRAGYVEVAGLPTWHEVRGGKVRRFGTHSPSPGGRAWPGRSGYCQWVTLEVGGPAMSRLPPNPALKQLEALIGEWDVEVPQFAGQRGRATFEWLEDGAFLRFHTDAPDPAPAATLIISRDESSETYTVLHYDSRGVSRV